MYCLLSVAKIQVKKNPAPFGSGVLASGFFFRALDGPATCLQGNEYEYETEDKHGSRNQHLAQAALRNSGDGLGLGVMTVVHGLNLNEAVHTLSSVFLAKYQKTIQLSDMSRFYYSETSGEPDLK